MRIIGGRYKGRDLLPPQGSGTRPITGLVKKSLFGMLGEDLTGAVVLDLYCGTGTMGLEAASRNARHIYFAEKDRSALGRLSQNIRMLSAQDRCTVWAGDVTHRLHKWVAGVPDPVDVAFVDPPYQQVREWPWEEIIQDVFAPLAARLAAEGVVVLRSPADAALPASFGPLVVYRTRLYGDMTLTLLGLPGEAASSGVPGAPTEHPD